MSKRIAVVGSGPSGFYAVQALFKSDPEVRCDMYDRLPTPFGLVRGGVAPDHQKIKSVVKAYDKVAEDPRFRWFGHVELGTDITIEELLERYDQVVLAVGAQSARKMGIPGEDLPGSVSATEFVAWYNAHPDFQQHEFPLLDVHDVVVVGVGNVAMDVSRMLLASRAHLEVTDITDEALEQLQRSACCRVHVLGRRGPAQAAFTPKEIQEIAELDGIDVRVKDDEAVLDPLSAAWLEAEGDRAARDNVAFVQAHAGPREDRDCAEMWLRFYVQPVEILGDGKVEGIRVEKTRIVERDGWLACEGTGETEVIPAGLVLSAVGYRSVSIPGVPFDPKRGVFPNDEGQVLDGGVPVDDLFVVGWAKRGPTGLIGTNRQDSVATVNKMLATGVKHPAKGPDPKEWLDAKVPKHVNWEDWLKLDAAERARGAEKGKVRDKFTVVPEMLKHVDKH